MDMSKRTVQLRKPGKLIRFFWFSERQNKYFSKYMAQAKLFLIFFVCSRSRHPILKYHLNLIHSLICHFGRIPFKCTTPTQVLSRRNLRTVRHLSPAHIPLQNINNLGV